jgi:hypothetical protein
MEAIAVQPQTRRQLKTLRRVILLSAIAAFFYVFKPFAAVYVLLILAITVHELGHLIAGRLCGYRLVSFRVGPVEVRHLNLLQVPPSEKWTWQLHESPSSWVSGATIMLPTSHPVSKLMGRHLIYIIGGLVANLMAAFLVLPIARLDTGVGAAGKGFIALSGLLILGNVLPTARRGHETDGRQIYGLLFNKNRREAQLFLLTIVGRLAAVHRFASNRDVASAWRELQMILTTADRLIDSATDADVRERIVTVRDSLLKSLPTLAAANA